MVVTAQEITNILIKLSKNVISREEAQDWAIKCRNAFDANDLIFFPLDEEEKIWDALQFIELYAEKIDRETFLYSNYDLSIFIDENNWG